MTWVAVHRSVGCARGDLREPPDLSFESAAVQSWLEPGETLAIRTPAARPDTRLAVAALAAADDADAPRLRDDLFRACWVDGRDISDRRVVEEAAGRHLPHLTLRARRWRRNWLGLGCPDLPAVILEDGTLLRGGEAVDELTITRRARAANAHLGGADQRDATRRDASHG